ncbi:MAG: HAMP domain-containing sensor histidine kinase [Ruthenibacterium sp.]
MKFAQKLSCVIVLVLVTGFSVGGSVLLYGNFADALQSAAQQSAAQHAYACYSLESSILAQHSRGDKIDDAFLAGCAQNLHAAVDGEAAFSAIFGQNQTKKVAYTTLPDTVEKAASALSDGQMQYVRAGKAVYAVYAKHLLDGVRFVSAYDITPVFAARGRAVQRFLWLEGALLLCAVTAAAFLSRWLTKPLSALTSASRSIANGAYEQRTQIHTQDEIGLLSENFDTMAQAVENRVHALEDSVRSRDDFMGAFTHELKTPMTAILGYADTLRTMQCDPQEQRRAAGYIFSEAKRVESLSQKLLALMRISGEAPALTPVCLDAVFSAVHTAIQPLTGGVTLNFFACGATVMADAELLSDLLYNLAHNAIKACGAAGTVCVTSEKTPDQDAIAVIVADDGCGIPQEKVAHVTEPFYRVDKSRARKDGGSGIGLALCSRIAVLHGTSLQIESAQGVGTTVRFLLWPSPENAMTSTETDAPKEDAAAQLREKTSVPTAELCGEAAGEMQ